MMAFYPHAIVMVGQQSLRSTVIEARYLIANIRNHCKAPKRGSEYKGAITVVKKFRTSIGKANRCYKHRKQPSTLQDPKA